MMRKGKERMLVMPSCLTILNRNGLRIGAGVVWICFECGSSGGAGQGGFSFQCFRPTRSKPLHHPHRSQVEAPAATAEHSTKRSASSPAPENSQDWRQVRSCESQR